jgi:DNA polymerase/3'-5' exonuclease PolX
MILHTDIVGEWVINRSIRDIINKKEFKLSGNGIFTNKNNIFPL